MCEREGKKTIAPDHVIKALKVQLGIVSAGCFVVPPATMLLVAPGLRELSVLIDWLSNSLVRSGLLTLQLAALPSPAQKLGFDDYVAETQAMITEHKEEKQVRALLLLWPAVCVYATRVRVT